MALNKVGLYCKALLIVRGRGLDMEALLRVLRDGVAIAKAWL